MNDRQYENYTIYDCSDILQSMGIKYLTSESCGYSMRGLYDINDNGRELLNSFFGGLVEFNNRAWNYNDEYKYSVMLPRSIILELTIFCLLETEYSYILLMDESSCKDAGVYRFMSCWHDESFYERFKSLGFNYRIYSGKNRNYHHFSGRTI